MIRGHQLVAAPLQPLSAKLRDTASGIENRLGGGGAEADDHLGMNRVNLAHQKWRAGGNLIGLWRAIFRWAAFHHVADVDVAALQAHSLNHLCQEFSSASDKRQALRVFVRAGDRASKYKLRFGIAIAKQHFIAG